MATFKSKNPLVRRARTTAEQFYNPPFELDLFLNKRVKDWYFPSSSVPKSIDESYGIDFTEYVAQIKQTKIWGKSVSIECQKDPSLQTALDELLADIDLYDFCHSAEHSISGWGGVPIIIDINEFSGRAIWNLIPPYQYNIRRIYNQPYYCELTLANEGVEINWTYSRDKFKQRVHVVDPSKTTPERLKVLGLVNKEKKLKFNQIPIYVWFNRPVHAKWGNLFAHFSPDLNAIVGAQVISSFAFRNLFHELQANKTRSTLLVSPEMKKELDNSPQKMKDVIYSTYELIVENVQTAGGTPQGVQDFVNVVPGNLVLQPWLEAFKEFEQLILRYLHFSEGSESGVQQTATEIAYENRSDSEEIGKFKQLRRKQLKNLIIQTYRMAVDDERSDRELRDLIVVKLHENLGVDRGKRTEEAQVWMGMGIMSPVQAVQHIWDYTEEEAIQHLKKTQQQNQEFKPQLQISPNSEESESEPEK